MAGPPRPARTAALTSRQDASRRRKSPQLSITVARPMCTRPMGGLRTEFAQLSIPTCRPSCPPAQGDLRADCAPQRA